jgi:hypothetical protein
MRYSTSRKECGLNVKEKVVLQVAGGKIGLLLSNYNASLISPEVNPRFTNEVSVKLGNG